MRQFKGLWIPVEVLRDDRLTAIDRMLWADINSFTSDEMTYFKSRPTIAKDMGVSEATVTRSIKKLIETEWVRVVSFDGRTRHLHAIGPRQIDAPVESKRDISRVKLKHELSQSDSQSNTEENTTRKQPRVRPTPEEVVLYFQELGSDEGQQFYDYYAAAGWKRKGNVTIKDWKAAARNWVRNAGKFRKQKHRGRIDSSNFTANGLNDFLANG